MTCKYGNEIWCKTVDGHHVHLANARVAWCEDWDAIPVKGTCHLRWEATGDEYASERLYHRAVEQIIIVEHTGRGLEVTFEGRHAILGGTYLNSPEAMLAVAEQREQEAIEAAFRARRLRALAEHVAAEQAAEQAAEASQARAQRNARAAATRAQGTCLVPGTVVADPS